MDLKVSDFLVCHIVTEKQETLFFLRLKKALPIKIQYL